ncbi:hypothetical protein V2J09_023633 [Rumex salicifolius]
MCKNLSRLHAHFNPQELPPAERISYNRENLQIRAYSVSNLRGTLISQERHLLDLKNAFDTSEIKQLKHIHNNQACLSLHCSSDTMTTRGGPSAPQRKVKSITIISFLPIPFPVVLYSDIIANNLSRMKYGMILVADKGLTTSSFTSARLKRGDVLYMENHKHRYELCFIREKVIESDSTSQSSDTEQSQNYHSDAAKDDYVNIYRFSRCKKNLPQSAMLKEGIPLPVDLLDVIDDDLDWEDVQWSETGLWVGGKEYNIVRMIYLSPTGVASIL